MMTEAEEYEMKCRDYEAESAARGGSQVTEPSRVALGRVVRQLVDALTAAKKLPNEQED